MVGGNPSVGGGGFAASPAGTAPLYYKSAEIASGSAKNLCKKSGGVGGVCLLCRLPTLPLACFPAPYPPDPLPRRGRGRPRLFHARGFAPCIPGAEPRRRWLDLPLWKTQWGACPGVAGAAGVSDTRRGACPVGRLPTLPLPSFLPPIPPSPFPGGEGGESKFSYARGFAPCIPGAEPRRHLQNLPSRYPAAEIRDLPQKRQEAVPYEQCRQPRRGGTGGEELRRLRWSSPPGQGEPVPQGESPPRRTPQRQGQQVPRGFSPLRTPQRRG